MRFLLSFGYKPHKGVVGLAGRHDGRAFGHFVEDAVEHVQQGETFGVFVQQSFNTRVRVELVRLDCPEKKP